MAAAMDLNERLGSVAARTLGADRVDHVDVTPALASDGSDALRVLVVLKPGAADLLRGQELIQVPLAMRRELEGSGDDRLPLIHYDDPAEPDDGDPEP